jgi:hypothetical protein
MSAKEACLLESVLPSRPTETPAGWAVTRALTRVGRLMTLKRLRTHGPRAKTRDVRRVLLIAPPAGSGTPPGGSGSLPSAGFLPPLGLVAVAESLQAAGFEAEIYDAMASPLSAESIRLHIEHSYPHVVAAGTCAATADTARDVLRAAKEAIPGVFTVLLGMQATSVAGKTSRAKDGFVDCVIGDDGAEILPRLLTRLRGASSTSQSRKHTPLDSPHAAPGAEMAAELP